jgi:hypothetical protein
MEFKFADGPIIKAHWWQVSGVCKSNNMNVHLPCKMKSCKCPHHNGAELDTSSEDTSDSLCRSNQTMLTRNLRLIFSFAASLATTSGLVIAFYLHDAATFIGGQSSPFISASYPLYVLMLTVGTVLVWRCMATIFGAD